MKTGDQVIEGTNTLQTQNYDGNVISRISIPYPITSA